MRGFGLVELMIALLLGVILALGVAQIFVSARQTYTVQQSNARMQEDARFALGMIVHDLRMVGMFGCLKMDTVTNAPTKFNKPLVFDTTAKSLTLITSSSESGMKKPGQADWTIKTDCKSVASAVGGAAAPDAGQLALPIREVSYKLNGENLQIKANASGSYETLVNGVSGFDISYGVANSPMDAYVSSYDAAPSNMDRVRSVRVVLTMHSPSAAVADQSFSAVATLRNRLP